MTQTHPRPWPCTCKMKVDTHKSVGVYFFHGKMKKRR